MRLPDGAFGAVLGDDPDHGPAALHLQRRHHLRRLLHRRRDRRRARVAGWSAFAGPDAAAGASPHVRRWAGGREVLRRCDGKGVNKKSKQDHHHPARRRLENDVRVRGEGDGRSKGGRPGDLYVFLSVKGDPRRLRRADGDQPDVGGGTSTPSSTSILRVPTVDHYRRPAGGGGTTTTTLRVESQWPSSTTSTCEGATTSRSRSRCSQKPRGAERVSQIRRGDQVARTGPPSSRGRGPVSGDRICSGALWTTSDRRFLRMQTCTTTRRSPPPWPTALRRLRARAWCPGAARGWWTSRRCCVVHPASSASTLPTVATRR